MGQTDSKKKLGRFELRVSEDDQDVAYLRLPSHPGETCKMSKSIRLAELMGSYTGPDVNRAPGVIPADNEAHGGATQPKKVMDHLEHLAKQVLETGGAETERAFRDALRHISDPDVLRVLAGKFYAEPEVSVPTHERLLELLPKDVLTRVEFGFIYFLMGEDGEASRQLGMAQALDPEHVQVLSLEAALARKSAEKVRLYRRILQKEPLNEIARGKLRELGETP